MQVEERLKFLASGVKPRKNKEAMAEVLAELKADGLFYGDTVNVRKTVDSEGEDNNEEAVVEKKRRCQHKADKSVGGSVVGGDRHDVLPGEQARTQPQPKGWTENNKLLANM